MRNITENICNCNELRDKNSFRGWDDFDKFVQVLDANHTFTKVPVEYYLYSVNFDERWYRCEGCKKVWRLIEPDPPYEGEWKQIEEEEKI